MNTLIDKDSELPWFEDTNFTGWLVQFKAHLRKTGLHILLDTPRPSDVNEDGDLSKLCPPTSAELSSSISGSTTSGIISLSRSSLRLAASTPKLKNTAKGDN